MDEKALRKNLVELLEGGAAHVSARDAIEGIDPRSATTRPDRMPHSIWELLEHARIAQEDILRYTLDPDWKSPAWPEGYWPDNPAILDKKTLNKSVKSFLSDLDELIALARDGGRDLTAKIPHGEGRTYLREILLAADHNAYHLGQIVLVRKKVMSNES